LSTCRKTRAFVCVGGRRRECHRVLSGQMRVAETEVEKGGRGGQSSSAFRCVFFQPLPVPVCVGVQEIPPSPPGPSTKTTPTHPLFILIHSALLFYVFFLSLLSRYAPAALMRSSPSSSAAPLQSTRHTTAPTEVHRHHQHPQERKQACTPTSQSKAKSARVVPSPLPPLDHVALAAAVADRTPSAALFRTQQNHDAPPVQPTGPYRGVALAVLNRLLQSQSPPLSLGMTEASRATTPSSLIASVLEETEKNGGDAGALAHASNTASDTNEKVDADGVGATDSVGCDETEDVMPWWKRILIDQPYRQRLMRFSTEAYRNELKLLHDTPDVISGSAGMEKRKALRERRWWKDELAEDVTPLRYKLDDSNVAADLPQPHEKSERENAASRSTEATLTSSSAPPMTDEVEETVVMSQHVALRIPLHNTIASTFAMHHPHAIIHASALETIRGVALGVMPPVQYAHEQEEQEAAIDDYLRTQRRLSRETSLVLKRKHAKDILAGRAEVPMQTAITDAVLQAAAAPSSSSSSSQQQRQQHGMQLRAVRASPLTWLSDEEHELDSNNSTLQNSRPGTPLGVRRRLPRCSQVIAKAQHAINVAEINIRSSALTPCPAIPSNAMTKTTGAATELGRCSSHHLRVKEEGHSPKAREVTRAEMFAEQHRLRCEEAALACIDGTENLYGLQYVWRLPLPPSGFIRVVPDPRYAMWPDGAVHDEEEKGSHIFHASTGGGAPGAGSRHHYHHRGGGNTAAATVVSSRHRQREMRRLARRVNQRTRKLHWLHDIGRRHVCYNDVALLTDSETSTPRSSSSFAALPPDWNPKSPSRFSLSVVRQLEQKKRGVAVDRGGSASRKRGNFATVRGGGAAHRDSAQPLYDGALNINIYADVIDRKKRRENSRGREKNTVYNAGGVAQSDVDGTATMSTRRVFLGCYRQSRLLIHYKMYCRALHEEARVRCGSLLTHVTKAHPHHSAAVAAAASSQSYLLDEGTSALLHGVPVIPYPVLRLQTQPPSLRQPHARQTPVLSTISEARCWVGLFPSAKVDLTTTEYHSWRTLRESALVQQALRDLFEDLPHDKEGLLDKRTFVLFVLRLLELFFPTHLGPTIHVAIAEEEWVYRGTTEHVGPHTFHEKFFGFPFIFLRDVAAVTEAELVEFWSILRVCLRAQQEAARPRLHGEAAAATSPDDFLAALHLLAPLSSFDPAQLHALITKPPPAFDPAVYDRFCLLTEAYRSDPMVRKAPCAQQYTVARIRVEQQLRVLQKQRQHDDGQVNVASDIAAAAGPKPDVGKAIPETQNDNVVLSLSDMLSTSTGTASSRVGVENAVEREREEHQHHLEAQEKRVLLERSAYYQQRQQRLHERAAAALSGIDCTSSSWELHRTDVYEPPSRSREEEKTEAADATGSTANEDNEEVEEALLDYLEGVPPDVFSGRVSLRERYLLHAGYQHQRQAHKLPWLQSGANYHSANRNDDTSMASMATARSETVSRSNTIRAADPDREVKARRFLSVMKGEGDTVRERQHVVAAEYERLLGGASTRQAESAALEAADGNYAAVTTSYASGMYPLRPVPRRMSSIITPSDPRARARILGKKDYDMQETGRHRGSDTTPHQRQVSERPARLPRRTHSRLRGKKTSTLPSSFYIARSPATYHQLPKRAAAVSVAAAAATTGSSNIIISAQPATASTPAEGITPAAGVSPAQQQLKQRVASRANVKRSASQAAMRHGKWSFHHSAAAPAPSQPVSTDRPEVVAAPAVVSSAFSSLRTSLRSSFIGSVAFIKATRDDQHTGHGGGSAGLARPTGTVAFLDADSGNANHNNGDDVDGDGHSTVAAASVLLDSSRSFFHGCDSRHASSVPPVGPALSVGGAGGDDRAAVVQQQQQQHLSAAALATHYVGRLRAQQRRQQQYKLQFNSGENPNAVRK
jgi:hypothetical protein